MIERVGVVDSVETICVHHLVELHVRRDGRLEIRKVKVEGSHTPSSRDNASAWDSDGPFKDGYIVCSLKRVSSGDVVFVVPYFNRYRVLSGHVNVLGVNLVPEEMEEVVTPLAVEFGDMLVLHSFIFWDGSVTKIVLKSDFRGLNK